MKRMLCEAACQIALFLGLTSTGFSIGDWLESSHPHVGRRLAGMGITSALAVTVIPKWSQLFDRLWPKRVEQRLAK